MAEANQTFDSRRTPRDQDIRVAATAAFGLTAIKPIIDFQTSVFRTYGEMCELMARNCEKSLEAFGRTIESNQ